MPVTELVAKDSVITHAKSKRTTTYGAVAARAAQNPLPDPAKDELWAVPPDKKARTPGVPKFSPLKELAARVKVEAAKWSKAMSEAGIEPE